MCRASCGKGAAVMYTQCDGQPRSPRARSARRALLPRRSGPAAAGARSPAFEGQRCAPAPAAVPVCFCPAGAVAGPFPGRDPAGCALRSAELRQHRPCSRRPPEVSRAQSKCRLPCFPCIPLGDSTLSISLSNLTELQASAALNSALFWEGAKTANVKHRM